MNSAKISIAILLTAGTSAFHMPHPIALNTVQDAKNQARKLIRCFESSPEGVRLSEPIYELCSYMPDPYDNSKVYVNGVSEDSDDYTSVLAMFKTGSGHAMLQVCLQEAFQFHRPDQPSQISLRCLCKRSGCNLNKEMPYNFDYNKKVLPSIR
uniref:ZP domain-containing protein n=3 Tax=Caenorhabditis japonica TaxID=281687 RepID=A0A8R1DU94_CAEJA